MPTAPRPLTRPLCDAFPAPATGQAFLWDAGDRGVKGLGLRVTASGARAWVFQYTNAAGGKRRLTLGDYGARTLDQARADARAARVDAERARLTPGALDPAQARDAVRDDARAVRARATVAELFDAFLAERARRGAKPATLAEYRRLLGTRPGRDGAPVAGGLRAVFGARAVADVTRRDVQAHHDARLTTPSAAWHDVVLLSACFAFAEREEWLPASANPCRHVRRVKCAPRRQSLQEADYHALGRALADAERAGLPTAPARRGRARGVSAARQAKATGRTRGPYVRTAPATRTPQNPVAVAVLRFLALSGWRGGEAKALRWDALDLTRGVATLADTKTGRSVRPLGAAALAVCTELRRHPLYPPATPYVFPQLDTPGRPITEVDHVWAAVRHAAGLGPADAPDASDDAGARADGVTVHGLRHAFTTTARWLGYGDHVIAKLVGHVLNATQTSRYGDVPDVQVREAAERVARHIAAMLDPTPAAVLAFPGGHAAAAPGRPVAV